MVEISFEQYEPTARKIDSYLVGFALPGSDSTNLCGSGTLVRIDDIFGVMTAAHVIDAIWDSRSEHVGLILSSMRPNQIHKLTLNKQLLRRCQVERPAAERHPPDIGFVQLSENYVATIQAKKSSANLSDGSEFIPVCGLSNSGGLWLLAGFAGEWTRQKLWQPELGNFVEFVGQIIDGRASPATSKLGQHYWELEITVNEEFPGPTSFGGYSGGGVWRVELEMGGGETKVSDECRFAGVAFYESGLVDGVNTIRVNERIQILKCIEDVRSRN